MITTHQDELQPGRLFKAEPLAASAVGSFALHGVLLAAVIFYGVLIGFFRPHQWGSPSAGGAIQVNLVSSALPLPADQPTNDNVLATDAPSKAPAPPTPKAKEAIDNTAIPIADKVKQKDKQATPKALHQPPPKPDNLARYGEQSGSSIPRALNPQAASAGPVSINDSTFGSRFPWYIDGINRKMVLSFNRGEVTASTPKGARAYITFSIGRDGSPSGVQVDRSSGASTLDKACQRAAQRIDSFDRLPAAYNQSTLKVSYYCEF